MTRGPDTPEDIQHYIEATGRACEIASEWKLRQAGFTDSKTDIPKEGAIFVISMQATMTALFKDMSEERFKHASDRDPEAWLDSKGLAYTRDYNEGRAIIRRLKAARARKEGSK